VKQKNALTFDVIKGSNTAEKQHSSQPELITAELTEPQSSWRRTRRQSRRTRSYQTAHGEADVAVTLTATISKGSASDSKTFNLTVKAKTVQDVSGIAVKTQPADLTYTAGSL
jgi:hypothetical protein